jgi:hypothetical protein
VVLSVVVAGARVVVGVSPDREAAAIEGNATIVVSGDPDLLVLEQHAGVRILTPKAFIDEIDAQRERRPHPGEQ